MSDTPARKPVNHVQEDGLHAAFIAHSAEKESDILHSTKEEGGEISPAPSHNRVENLSREAWLSRCAMAYDVGLVTEKRLALMSRWLGVVHWEGHSRFIDRHNSYPPTPKAQGPSPDTQYPHPHIRVSGPARWDKVDAFWNGPDGELERLERKSAKMYHQPGDANTSPKPLATQANDVDGYALTLLAAIFSHPCQQCATDPEAWWLLPASCQHSQPEPVAFLAPAKQKPKQETPAHLPRQGKGHRLSLVRLIEMGFWRLRGRSLPGETTPVGRSEDAEDSTMHLRGNSLAREQEADKTRTANTR